MAADELLGLGDLEVGRRFVVRGAIAGAGSHVAECLVVHSQCNHDPQTADIGTPDPVHPHFLVGDIVPDRPGGKVRGAAGIVGLIRGPGRALLRGVNDCGAKIVATRIAEYVYSAVSGIIVTRSLLHAGRADIVMAVWIGRKKRTGVDAAVYQFSAESQVRERV